MTMPDDVARRTMLFKLGLAFSGLVATAMGVPILSYLLSPLVRDRGGRDESWLSLGAVDRFPPGTTRLSSYRNPRATAWDGETANVACWVRRIDDHTFQVFATNCAHLGCPVRWFSQSRLFLCPCHGGAYYEDGSRASGPPQRGLFEYAYRIDGANLLILAGEMPTPGRSASASKDGASCA